MFLILFYIFTFEAEFPKYKEDIDELQALTAEYEMIIERLDLLEQRGEIGAFDKRTIIELSENVLKEVVKKYDNVKKGVGEIISGALIETEARKLWDEGRLEGINKGRLSAYAEMLREGLISVSDAASHLDMTEEELCEQMKKQELSV